MKKVDFWLESGVFFILTIGEFEKKGEIRIVFTPPGSGGVKLTENIFEKYAG
ncbi:MAG: hypothetical protein J6W00_14850 [Lentisphaeria bacterium]|nr:hypothetical protein [Lentisphaeria bacterium]